MDYYELHDVLTYVIAGAVVLVLLVAWLSFRNSKKNKYDDVFPLAPEVEGPPADLVKTDEKVVAETVPSEPIPVKKGRKPRAVKSTKVVTTTPVKKAKKKTASKKV